MGGASEWRVLDPLTIKAGRGIVYCKSISRISSRGRQSIENYQLILEPVRRNCWYDRLPRLGLPYQLRPCSNRRALIMITHAGYEACIGTMDLPVLWNTFSLRSAMRDAESGRGMHELGASLDTRYMWFVFHRCRVKPIRVSVPVYYVFCLMVVVSSHHYTRKHLIGWYDWKAKGAHRDWECLL
jgi:hypothetical protein